MRTRSRGMWSRTMSSKRPILIVEDDAALRGVLAEQLAETGDFHPVEAASLEQATQLLDDVEIGFDLIILDVNLPDGDGCGFCAHMRRQGHKMPILMLTGSSAEADVIRGLEAGANDYIIKPFRMNELLARMKTHLRVFKNSVDATFEIGQYTFRPSSRILFDRQNNKRIILTWKEVGILKFLSKTGGQIVRRETILDQVWGYSTSVETHTLETHIYRLRQKIEADPSDCRLLLTVPGGYQLANSNYAAARDH
jgi:DNA-binding response OmpR family regulator